MKHLNLRQLEIFQSVVRHLSFSRAAEALYLTQSAVSQHIKQLEEHFGVKLFLQIGKNVILTEAGNQLFDHADKLFALLAETEQVMDDLRELRRGSLNVTADTAAGVYIVPTLLGQFHRDHPMVQIKLEVANRRSVLQRLLWNETDLAIMGYPEDASGLAADPFADNNLVVIASPAHPLASKSSITLEELSAEPFLIREAGSGTRTTLERHLYQFGITLNTTMELGNNSAIKEAVAAGLGVSVVSQSTVGMEVMIEKLVILPVEHFPIERKWFVVHSTQRPMAPLVESFRSALLSHDYLF